MIKIHLKNILILSIFIFFISISGVCADELNESDNGNIEIDDGTFANLETKINNASDGDVISLYNDYSYEENYTEEGISISKNLTIDGNGFAIDALNKARIFIVDNDSSVTFKNIIFKNGYAKEGGAIRFLQEIENCNIFNCIFENNIAEDGGAIFYSNQVVNTTIRNTTFINNSATLGGAICFKDNILESVFDNNTFINNGKPNCDGGGINIDGFSANNIFNNLIFINNKADLGGAIHSYNENYRDTFSNSTFINNSANAGGAITFKEIYESKIENLIFINNTAADSGGALETQSIFDTSFNNITFINNTAKTGGAADFHGNMENNTLENLIFINNTSIRNGGAMFIFEVVRQSDFKKMTFINNKGLNGAALYANMAIINSTFTNVDFINNTAEINGGGLYSAFPFALNLMENCNFIKNTAENASAIYFGGETINNIINNCNFINNNANDSGLIYSQDIETNNYTNNNFINNSAKNYGGILFNQINECNIINCIFENNTADITSDISYIAASFGSVINSTFNGKNHIYITEESNLRFIDNIELSKFDENNYFILNDGILSLQNNTLNNYIINNGNILTQTSIIVLNNESINVTSPDVTLYAQCLDDNENTIIGDYLTFDINQTLFKVFFNGRQMVETQYLLENTGSYLINATCTPNLSNCTYRTGIINFNSKKSANISASDIQCKAGEYIELNVTLDENATGTVIVEIDNKTYAGLAYNGNALIIIAPLNPGIYSTNIYYSGDENYNPDICESEINVSSKINVEVKSVVKYYKGPERLIVNITQDNKPVANKKVEIRINGVVYERITAEDGIASLALNLESGRYDVITNVDDESIISQVIIKSTINSTDLLKTFRNDTQFYVTLMDSEGNPLKDATVTFNIHGVFYNRTTDENGVAKLNINLEPGEYIITSVNTVNGEMKSNKITVLSQFIEHGDFNKTYGDPTPYTIRLAAKDGSIEGEGCKVLFNINGVFYTRTTNSTGHVSLNINLQAGEYIITSSYKDELISDKITVY